MIPKAFIDEWKTKHPWQQDEFAEQDLILSKILIDLYSTPVISEKLIFRGGTALHKLFFQKACRYSEDLDFVQIKREAIGDVLTELRKKNQETIKDKPKFEIHEGRALLIYKYNAENPPNPKMKLKIEINTREHFNIEPIEQKVFKCDSLWFSGEITAKITTFSLNEMLATKLRALYQRKKGRDLFDLFMAKDLAINYEKVVKIFQKYMSKENRKIDKRSFLENMRLKIESKQFELDLKPLVHPDFDYNIKEAYEYVKNNYILNL